MTLPRSSTIKPVVAVIGTTGVGKSDLAIALADSLRSSRTGIDPPNKKYDDGVVLSADSMQIYQGLDVITNKITKEEMKEIRHWGMDMVKPGEGNWEMGRWCIEAEREVSSSAQIWLRRNMDMD
jgi:tRNA A37 N6-isopentenylltransferase MiaA